MSMFQCPEMLQTSCAALFLPFLPSSQVSQALELYPQHADSLELKKQLRLQLNAV
jgi:hypothetical protein